MTTTKTAAPAGFSKQKYQPIAMTPVKSAQVGAVGYDAATKTLAVTFARGNGHVYHYPNVDADMHAKFMAADSKGAFFGKHVKAMPFEKFEAPKPLQPLK